MPGCGGTSCSCAVKVGPGLTLSGSGGLDNPFLISLDGAIEDSLGVQDTPTVNLQLTGSGAPSDPYRLSAFATMSVADLTDVSDPEGGPSAGDTIVWVTAGVATPRFEFRPPPPNPAGAVNVGAGIVGTGALGSPIAAALVGTSAGDPAASGLEVFVDEFGDLRAVAPVATAVTWGSIIGRPASFPTTPDDFTGVLPAAKGGTGVNDLALATVGNAVKVDGHRVFVQSATPSGAVVNDLWFWG